jgi:hypothetical protein
MVFVTSMISKSETKLFTVEALTNSMTSRPTGKEVHNDVLTSTMDY